MLYCTALLELVAIINKVITVNTFHLNVELKRVQVLFLCILIMYFQIVL